MRNCHPGAISRVQKAEAKAVRKGNGFRLPVCNLNHAAVAGQEGLEYTPTDAVLGPCLHCGKKSVFLTRVS